jgi:hypothetical protein
VLLPSGPEAPGGKIRAEVVDGASNDGAVVTLTSISGSK